MSEDMAKPINIDKEVPREASSVCPASKKTTIGGQALIDGLMMFGPRKFAMAIRKPDGSIYIEEIKQVGRNFRYRCGQGRGGGRSSRECRSGDFGII